MCCRCPQKQNEEWEPAKLAFQKAIAQSTDAVEAAWIEFELIDMQLEQEQYDELETMLYRLRSHDNPEVRVQAHIRSAQWLIQTERPSEALDILSAVDAQPLGPGWDTSLEEFRAVAHRELGDYEGAIDVYLALANRWPNNEEAEIPAWLGIASIHQQTGTVSQAREWAQRVADNAEDPVYQAQAEAILNAL